MAQGDKINMEFGVYGPDDVARSRFGENGYSVEMLPVTPVEEPDEPEPEEPEEEPEEEPAEEPVDEVEEETEEPEEAAG